jgi:hypothetical protein
MLNVFGTVTGRGSTTAPITVIDIITGRITGTGGRGIIIGDRITTATMARHIVLTTTVITGPGIGTIVIGRPEIEGLARPRRFCGWRGSSIAVPLQYRRHDFSRLHTVNVFLS